MQHHETLRIAGCDVFLCCSSTMRFFYHSLNHAPRGWREAGVCCSALRVFPMTRVDPWERFLRNNFTENFILLSCFNLEAVAPTVPIPAPVTCVSLVARYVQGWKMKFATFLIQGRYSNPSPPFQRFRNQQNHSWKFIPSVLANCFMIKILTLALENL